MIREFKKAGATIRELTDAEYDAWVKLAKETAWKRFEQNVPGGAKLIAAVEDSIAALPKTQ